MGLNPNCDGANCWKAEGEVRRLPTGGDGAVIVCFGCYCHEMSYRNDLNKELHPDNRFESPDWEDLEIYENNQMSLYLVSRTDRIDWDENAAAVICCNSQNRAESIFMNLRDTPTSTTIKTELIGAPIDKFKAECVVLVDFKAG